MVESLRHTIISTAIATSYM